MVDVNTVKPQKDALLASLLLFCARWDKNQRKAEIGLPCYGHKANMRAPRCTHLQELHWRVKVGDEIPLYLPVKKPPKTNPPSQVKHNSSSFKPYLQSLPAVGWG